ncbi:MAG: serine esterase [Verrucomicrobia bacterium]|nr:serine esterase [Verrucomicrobiota bacterium]
MLATELVAARIPTSRSLMVVLHGLGDSMEGYRWLPSMLGLPWLNYLLVNAPDLYYGGYSWYDYTGDAGPGVIRSRQLLTAVLDQQRERGFPPEQTFLFGFSQGCLMTIDVGLRYPHRLSGLIGISGYVFEPEKLVQALSPVALQQRVLLTHGTQDALIPAAPVRDQIALLKAAGINLEWHEFVKDHTIAGEEEVRVIRDFVTRQDNRAQTGAPS